MNLATQQISTVLHESNEKFNLLLDLYNSKKLPKVLMLSGKKGSGKFTLINHFLNYVFNKTGYDLNLKKIDDNSLFYKQFINHVSPNVIYLAGSNYKNVKIDDIRALKTTILQSHISEKERYIIFDDVELFNINSMNALLKIIEEPSSNNNFILINNQTKPIIKTVHSRCLEIKIFLTNQKRINIIELLIKKNNLSPIIDYKSINITPGNFFIFNDICQKNKIDINKNFTQNLEKISILYKKNKDLNFINLMLFLTDIFFHNKIFNLTENNEDLFEIKNFVKENINKFVMFNLNKNSLINAINNKFSND